MRYKRFGKTEMNASVATVGTWAIGGDRWGDIDDQRSIDAIRAMLDNGVNFIDTAPCYGWGHSEEVVGKAIKGLDRSKLIISTKVGLVLNAAEKRVDRINTREEIFREVDISLGLLGTDYIDLYIIHWPDFKTPAEETMTAMSDLVKAGKIRHIGVSNYSIEQIEEASKYATIGAIQPPFSMLTREAQPIMEYAQAHDIAVMTYGSLGAGMLTGAYRTAADMADWAPDDTRYNFYPFFKEPKFSKCQVLLKTLDAIAAAHNRPVAQVAVNWITQHPLVNTALMGVRNVAEANENCAGTEWMLTDEEIAMINKAIEVYEQE